MIVRIRVKFLYLLIRPKGFGHEKDFIYLLSTVVAGVFSLNAANAATATGTLTVRATVTNSCVLNTFNWHDNKCRFRFWHFKFWQC